MMETIVPEAAEGPTRTATRPGFQWESQVVCVTAASAYALAKVINDYYAGRFVVGTHTFEPKRPGDPWTALIYFKVRK